jgi:hypothetical protein
MAKSPTNQQLIADSKREAARDARREDILKVLLIRFVSDEKEFEEELKAGLKGIVDDSRLEQLFEYTLRCADVFYFRQALLPGSGGRASKVDPEVRREIIAEWVQQNLKIDLGILEDTIALENRHAALSATQDSILVALECRFGAKARTLETKIKAIGIFEDDRLDELLKHAATCRTLDSFRKQLAQ